MKRIASILLVFCLVLTACGSTLAESEDTSEPETNMIETTEEEMTGIVFRNLPWGISFTEAYERTEDLGLIAEPGEDYGMIDCSYILTGEETLDIENYGINIVSHPENYEIKVAGYTTFNVTLFFAYIPVDGELTRSEDDSALYGAQYYFDTVNFDEMAQDLVVKLTETYGEPSETVSGYDLNGYECEFTVWYDEENNSALSINTTSNIPDDADEEIVISYVWLDGDDLLLTAYDYMEDIRVDEEAEIYDNGDTSGL